MPTKKRRVGFIPRSDVLEIINQLSTENNLSNSKVINILVEEALYKRGIFQINKENVTKNSGRTINNNRLINELNESSQQSINSIPREFNIQSLDLEIYEKFIMFLQFQEKMNRNKKL